MKAIRNQIVALLLVSLCGTLYAASPGCWLTRKCHFCGTKTCKLKVEKETEEVPCFEVECKDICIPPITLPWQCGPTRCGKVRTVKVLKEDSYEREVCTYSWEVITICPSCQQCLKNAGCDLAPGVVRGLCDSGHCDEAGCDEDCCRSQQ